MRLRLGGKWWNLRFSRHMKAHDGFCNREKKIVTISTDLNEKETLETIIHELTHACDTNGMIGEYWVKQTAEEISNALWALGYRKKES